MLKNGSAFYPVAGPFQEACFRCGNITVHFPPTKFIEKIFNTLSILRQINSSQGVCPALFYTLVKSGRDN